MRNKPSILFMEARENLFGHKRQNEAIIRALSEFADVTIAFPDDCFYDLPSDVKYHNFSPAGKMKNFQMNQITKSFQCIAYANQMDRKYHYDYIFFSSYILYSLVYAGAVIKDSRRRVFVLHHNIIDQINESLLKRILFRLCKNRTQHVLIEEFVKDNFIEEAKVSAAFVYAIPHQLNKMERYEPVEFDFVGISNSNDEIWIRKIIDAERKTGCFMKNNIRIVLRSQTIDFDDNWLSVIKGQLSDKDYYNYILRARVVLVPFPSSFQYRVSGTVVDALSNKKRVMGSKIPIVMYYAQKYPHICAAGVDVEDLLEQQERAVRNEREDEEFADFVKLHSEQKFKDALRNIFLKSNQG